MKTNRKGRPPTGVKHRHVMLSDETIARAKVIGGGNISLGIRMSVAAMWIALEIEEPDAEQTEPEQIHPYSGSTAD